MISPTKKKTLKLQQKEMRERDRNLKYVYIYKFLKNKFFSGNLEHKEL
jgi:hypothetical protein